VDFQEGGLGNFEVCLPLMPFYTLLRDCCFHVQHSFLVTMLVNK
jgi:hypothetical protein